MKYAHTCVTIIVNTHNMPESSADTVAFVNTHPSVVHVCEAQVLNPSGFL